MLEPAINYYEHHLGDYLRDTAHLSMLEDGAYRRLLDAYYIREAPLPREPREVYRLVRAQSKPERDAVLQVLGEFFDETPEGWRHHRCDREIARFQDKQRKAKASADARWSQHQPKSGRNANAHANASSDAMRTHSEGNAPRARPQSPDTKHQTPEDQERATASAIVRAHDPPATPVGELGKALVRGGVPAAKFSTGDPRLMALADAGVTPDEVEAAARDGVSRGKGIGWIAAAVQGRRADAAALGTVAASGPRPEPPEPAWRTEQRDRMRSLAGPAALQPMAASTVVDITGVEHGQHRIAG